MRPFHKTLDERQFDVWTPADHGSKDEFVQHEAGDDDATLRHGLLKTDAVLTSTAAKCIDDDAGIQKRGHLSKSTGSGQTRSSRGG